MGLFDLFSNEKKEKIGHAQGSLGSLCSTLPDKQRASIILLLLEIAHSNKVVTDDENKMIFLVLNLLKVASNSDKNIKGQKVLKSITDEMEIADAIENLKFLSTYQRKEVMIWFASMLNLDDPNKRNNDLINSIAHSLSIDVSVFANENSEQLIEFLKSNFDVANNVSSNPSNNLTQNQLSCNQVDKIKTEVQSSFELIYMSIAQSKNRLNGQDFIEFAISIMKEAKRNNASEEEKKLIVDTLIAEFNKLLNPKMDRNQIQTIENILLGKSSIFKF